MTEDMNLNADEMMEETVILIDEEGNEHEFALIDMIEVDGNQYAVLSPLEDGEEAEEAIILKIVQDENGEDMLFDIEDDEEWEKVVDVWNDSLDAE